MRRLLSHPKRFASSHGHRATYHGYGTWAEKVTGVQPSHFDARKAGVTQEGSDLVTSSRKEPFQGWALKTQKKGQRATQNVKNFLLEKFNRGVETGNSSETFFPFTLVVWFLFQVLLLLSIR